ncbi:hypothetical protein BBJ28_00000676 [Nothophytophthora sp. Chile5]|nr:hypothetical protein BBJ28_00000676 [Nothophytophthora sp. Chile5]
MDKKHEQRSTNSKRVVLEAQKKPVRAQPMRGPGANSIAPGTANNTGHAGWKDGLNPSTSSAGGAVDSQAQQQATMKEEFCTQLLMDGYVQSYVDLFYLTHRNDSSSQPQGGSGGSTQFQAVSTSHSSEGSNGLAAENGGFASLELQEMEFLRDQLVAAEHCKRRGEIPDVMAAYDSLAAYCSEKQDTKTMIFFYEKCLEIARLVKDQVGEMRVLSQIGCGYHAAGELDHARQYLELYVAIAKVVYEHEDDAELRGEAHSQLGKVYADLAWRHEQAKQFSEAINVYKLRLDCAMKAGDAEAQTYAQFKIGACYNALDQPTDALPFLETNVRGYVMCALLTLLGFRHSFRLFTLVYWHFARQLSTARQSGDAEGEGNACAALATAHEKLGNQQVSIEFLNHYVAIAARTENVVNQADACARLGQIYTAAQNFQRAREMHEKNYELVPAVVARAGDRVAQNVSRVNVGAARANDKLATLLALVKDDFHGLLEWKSARTLPATE